MKKRTFSAEFKANMIIVLLKGEKELNVIANENDITPNQLCNWKNEFLANAANAFDNKKDEKPKESFKASEAEKDECIEKLGS